MSPHVRGVADVTLVTCAYENELSNVLWRWPNEGKSRILPGPWIHKYP